MRGLEMIREIYDEELPTWLRWMGCWAIQDNSYRFNWGEVSKGWGFDLKYSVYHETATINICLLYGNLFIKAPMIINQRDGTEDWCASYGLSYHSKGIWWAWRTKNWCFRMPWDWQHVRHTLLNPDGSVCCEAKELEHSWEPPEEIKETHAYTYHLRSGEIQHRKATIYGEEREWRWKWFKFLPYPRKVGRSISIDFDGEVGERSGSWKGGTVGCGYGWKHEETMLESLRRMEKERKF
jgi:hypothetical protein